MESAVSGHVTVGGLERLSWRLELVFFLEVDVHYCCLQSTTTTDKSHLPYSINPALDSLLLLFVSTTIPCCLVELAW